MIVIHVYTRTVTVTHNNFWLIHFMDWSKVKSENYTSHSQSHWIWLVINCCELKIFNFNTRTDKKMNNCLHSPTLLNKISYQYYHIISNQLSVNITSPIPNLAENQTSVFTFCMPWSWINKNHINQLINQSAIDVAHMSMSAYQR